MKSFKEYADGTMGININDKHEPWTELILTGQKTIETRNSNSLKRYIGKRIGIIRTGKGIATLVGYATLGWPKIYRTAEEFRADEDKHRVRLGTQFDFQNIKYGYPITKVERTKPRPITSWGMVARKI